MKRMALSIGLLSILLLASCTSLPFRELYVDNSLSFPKEVKGKNVLVAVSNFEMGRPVTQPYFGSEALTTPLFKCIKQKYEAVPVLIQTGANMQDVLAKHKGAYLLSIKVNQLQMQYIIGMPGNKDVRQNYWIMPLEVNAQLLTADQIVETASYNRVGTIWYSNGIDNETVGFSLRRWFHKEYLTAAEGYQRIGLDLCDQWW